MPRNETLWSAEPHLSRWRSVTRRRSPDVEKILHHRHHALDCASVNSGNIGRLRHSRAAFSATGKSPGLITKIRVKFLQVQWHRIMHRVADAVGVQMFLQFIAARMAHRVKMPRAFVVGRLTGNCNGVSASSSA